MQRIHTAHTNSSEEDTLVALYLCDEGLHTSPSNIKTKYKYHQIMI